MLDRFAQQIERRRDPGAVQFSERRHRGFARLARDEPRGEPAREPIAAHEAEDARLFAQPEQPSA